MRKGEESVWRRGLKGVGVSEEYVVRADGGEMPNLQQARASSAGDLSVEVLLGLSQCCWAMTKSLGACKVINSSPLSSFSKE